MRERIHSQTSQDAVKFKKSQINLLLFASQLLVLASPSLLVMRSITPHMKLYVLTTNLQMLILHKVQTCVKWILLNHRLRWKRQVVKLGSFLCTEPQDRTGDRTSQISQWRQQIDDLLEQKCNQLTAHGPGNLVTLLSQYSVYILLKK